MLIGDAFDVLLGKWPNGIAFGNELCDEVLKLAMRRVVWHQPDADARIPVDDGAATLGLWGKLYVLAKQTIANGLPASVRIVVGVHQDAEGYPSISRDLHIDCIQQRPTASLVLAMEGQIRREPLAQVFNDMLVVLSLHQKQLGRRRLIAYHALSDLDVLFGGHFELLLRVFHGPQLVIAPADADEIPFDVGVS